MKKRLLLLVLSLLMLTPLLFSCGQSDEYTIIFVVDGGEYRRQTLPADKLPSAVKNPTLQGYAFEGWYYDYGEWEHPFKLSEFSPERDTQDGELRVYAKFQKTYTVSFIAVNNVCKTETLTYDKKPTPPSSAPNIEGYRFGGWYLDNGVWSAPYESESFIPQTGAASGEISLYARYVPIYTVNFYVGGVLFETAEYDYNVKPTLPENPVKDGYDFSGWYFDAIISGRDMPFVLNTFNPEIYNAGAQISLYAHFIEKTTEDTLGGSLGGNFDPSGWTNP